jgi:hypothetical protein
MTAPIGLPALIRGVRGRALEDLVGSVDLSGNDAAEEAINDAIALAVAYGDPLRIGRGIYRLGASIRLESNSTLICHPEAEFVGHFSSAGINGMVMGAAGYNETDNPLRNIRIRGGKWRRYGVIEGDNEEIWTGYTGNVFSFWGEDVDLRDIWVTGYGGGRGFMYRGHRWYLGNCWIYNPDNTDGQATNVDGGTGGFRFTVGSQVVAENLICVCGDDCFQVVPGTTDATTEDVIYRDCWGISTTARVVAVGLGGSTEIAGNIKRVTYDHIRGESPSPVTIDNDNSSGELSVLLRDVKLSQRAVPPHKTNGTNTVAFNIGSGVSPAGGRVRVTMRDCEAVTLLNGAIKVSGTRATRVLIDGFRSPAPTNASSGQNVVTVEDCDEFVMRNFEVVGQGDIGTQSVVVMGRSDTTSLINVAVLEDGKITGVPAAAAGVYCTNHGVLDLTLSRLLIEPHSGASADAVRCSDNAEKVTIRDCDFSAMDTSPIASPAANLRVDNTLLAATTQLYQQSTAASTVAWDGRSEYIRLTASGAVTISTISLPTGFVMYRVPRITLYCVNAVDFTFDQAGNLETYNNADVTCNQGDIIQFVYDVVLEKWVQIAAHGAN